MNVEQRFVQWRKDWNLFADEVLKANLDKEQKEILSGVQHNKMVAVVSGTARGKDYVAAVAAMCFLYLTPKWDKDGIMIANTKVAMTAPSDRQVKNIMFVEISRLKKRATFLPGRLVGYDIRMDTEEEWFLTGFKADDHNTEVWTGFHAVNTMFVVTEASGMAELVYSAIEGNLQANSRLLIVFNYNRASGYAHNALKSKRFKHFRLSSLTAPNVLTRKDIIPGQVDYEWVKDKVDNWCTPVLRDEKGELQISKEIEGDFEWEDDLTGEISWYRPNDTFRIKVLGLAPRVSEDILIPESWLELAHQRWQQQQENKWKITKPLRLGVDVAGMGSDSTKFCFRFGNYVQKFTTVQATSATIHMEIAGRAVHVLRNHYDPYNGFYPKVFFDSIGEGAGVYSRCVELSEEPEGLWMKDMIYSAKGSYAAVIPGTDTPLTDWSKQYLFYNMRAYLYWCIRDWLNPENNTNAMLPPNANLDEELMETMWKFRSDGKIQIEAKEDIRLRLKRSPDDADSLAETFFPVEDYVVPLSQEKSFSKFLSMI